MINKNLRFCIQQINLCVFSTLYTPHRYTWLRYHLHHIMLPKITLTSDQLIIYMAQVPTTHSLAFVDITDAQINAYIAAHGRHEHFEKTCYKLSYQLSEDDQISKYGTLAALTKWMVPALCPKVTPASNKESRVTQLAAGLYLGPAPTGPTSFTHDTHTVTRHQRAPTFRTTTAGLP